MLYSAPFLGAAAAEICLQGWRPLRSLSFGITAHGENAIRQTLGRALVEEPEDGTALIYIDRHLLHEVTSPQAFEGLTLANRDLWRRSANLAVPDHNVSTLKSEREAGLDALPDAVSRVQLQTLDDNCEAFDVVEIPLNDVRQGIVHVMGPEQGAVLPGMTVVCGDSIHQPMGLRVRWRTASVRRKSST